MAKKMEAGQTQTLKKVLHYMKPYRFFLLLSVILAAITVASTLYLPLLIGKAVDCIVGKGNVNFDLITRAAVVYNTNKYFVGASLVMHTYDYRKRNFSLTNTFGTVRVYAGFNFWKRKEFRDK